MDGKQKRACAETLHLLQQLVLRAQEAAKERESETKRLKRTTTRLSRVSRIIEREINTKKKKPNNNSTYVHLYYIIYFTGVYSKTAGSRDDVRLYTAYYIHRCDIYIYIYNVLMNSA